MKYFLIFSVLGTVILSRQSNACMTGYSSNANPKQSSAITSKLHKTIRKRTPASQTEFANLPDVTTNPWGGSDRGKWIEEASFANAVSGAFNTAYSAIDASQLQDVVVAIPVKMISGHVPVSENNYANRPYGDGQTNARLTFGSTGSWQVKWNKMPPVVVTLIIRKDGNQVVNFQFNAQLKDSLTKGIEIQNGSSQYKVSTKSDGLNFSWQVPSGFQWGDTFSNKVVFFRGQGWQDWFPLDFRNVVVSNSDLLNAIDSSIRNLGPGNLIDPENVKASMTVPYDLINATAFGKELNAQHYNPVIGIHNQYFDNQGKQIQTAVGNGATVVLPSKSMNPAGIAPFKMAYLCFDGRNPAEEARVGAPSGAGWHEIGDPAETVINSVENGSVIFGYANGQPAEKTPSGTFAYGLSDIAVVHLIKPGQAIVTSAGPQTLAEGYSNNRGQGPASGRNYHWFIFNQNENICASEWVHPCVPNSKNNFGTKCNDSGN